MWVKLLVVALLVVFAVGLLYHAYLRDEGFSTKKEKAQTIVDWFMKNSRHSYENFRRATGGASNIVEYEDALKLFTAGKLTTDSIEKLL